MWQKGGSRITHTHADTHADTHTLEPITFTHWVGMATGDLWEWEYLCVT